ncbi:MAG TPA: hypothetical protein EYQ74_03400 [Planctomycetes bacterium]|nr:hypothetical protein [Planctomycetota bacterium]HIK60345.1 hypothetical protein [Planctomycetota bacterium]
MPIRPLVLLGGVILSNPDMGQVARLNPSDLDPADNFGCSTSVDGGHVLIGSRFDDDEGQSAGAAYAFDVDPLSPFFGHSYTRLIAMEKGKGDGFSYGLSIGDGIVAAGANGDDKKGTWAGAAHTFNLSRRRER